MDLVNKSLLSELVKNGRVAFVDLATRLDVPIEEVGSRIHRLVNERVILKFTVIPAPALFGGKEAIIFFRSNQPLDSERINSLGVHPTVEFISIGNKTEGFALIHYRTISELYSVLRYFQKVGSTFEDIKGYQVRPLITEQEPKKDIYALRDIDWMMLTHLREEGRLSLNDLSTRTNIAVETLIERLKFMRDNHLIQETILLNPAKTAKETWTMFCLKLTIFTEPIFDELTRELKTFSAYWSSSCWKVEEKPILLLGFLCSSYDEVEKIQNRLSEVAGLISVEKTMGGVTYYFPDFRDEVLEEKRSADWFQPERWVKK
ncbi:MAG: winged helix-turn-helix transcriptional regulator [Candidatus Hodarchaeales archaeon]|jgi:DNA-binding Lrp family transcriptional regulator